MGDVLWLFWIRKQGKRQGWWWVLRIFWIRWQQGQGQEQRGLFQLVLKSMLILVQQMKCLRSADHSLQAARQWLKSLIVPLLQGGLLIDAPCCSYRDGLSALRTDGL